MAQAAKVETGEVARPRLTLLALTEEQRRVEDMLSSCEREDGTVDPEIRNVLEKYLFTLTDESTDKLQDYVAVIKQTTRIAEAREAEAKALAALANTDRAKVDAMKERLKFHMQERGLVKVELPNGNIRLQANGGPLPVTIPDDASKVPYTFWKSPEIDPSRVRRFLEGGGELPGCAIEERGVHIRVV